MSAVPASADPVASLFAPSTTPSEPGADPASGPGPERLLRAAYDALDRHRLGAAVQTFHEAGTVAAQVGDPQRSCEATMSAGVAGTELGLWLIGLGQSDAARRVLRRSEADSRRALGLARRLDRADWSSLANAALALAAVALDRPADGERRGNVALIDARSSEHPEAELLALLAIGGAAWRLGRPTDGLRLLTVAERNAMLGGNDRWLLEVLREQLRAMEAEGAVEHAYSLARRTERLAASLVDQ